MGLLDFITGTKRPEPGVPQLPVEELRTRLLALNRPDLPWRIIDGTDQQVDLIAEWKIDDSRWKEQLEQWAKGTQDDTMMGLGGPTSRHLLKFDSTRSEVRSVDRNFTVESGRDGLKWHASVTWARGQARRKSFSFTRSSETGKLEKDYSFNTEDFKVPIRTVVTEAGWTYRGVAFGKL